MSADESNEPRCHDLGTNVDPAETSVTGIHIRPNYRLQHRDRVNADGANANPTAAAGEVEPCPLGCFCWLIAKMQSVSAVISTSMMSIASFESVFLSQIPEVSVTTIRARLFGGLLIVLAVGHLATVADEKKPDSGAKPGSEPLVTRGRVQLNLAGAEMIIAAAKKKSAAIGAHMNVAVVDDGGHLLAFARMDGARPASGYTALTKAVTGATFRQETGPRPATGEPDVLLNLSLQNAALASGGKLTTLKGGVPVIVDGQVIGAVGVGGGTGEQDAEVAKAGIQAFQDALDNQAASTANVNESRALPIAERLKKKISVDFKREFLSKAIALVSEETGVPISINGQDLKMVGVTQNEYQNFKFDNVTATTVLHRMLNPRQLVLVVDEASNQAIVTSRPAAENRGLKPLPLGEDNGK